MHPTSAEKILDDVVLSKGLNERQSIAFRIIARSFLQLLEAEHKGIPKEKQPQLRMFQSGPGGTGKTYVMRAVQEVMDHYGCGHCIRFTAPFGSCAASVKGYTLHSAFKIQEFDNYEVALSIQDKQKLEEEWNSTKVLVIDEVSLLGAQLLGEIDQIL
ncbi:PIF1-like helicase-domain-containing protein, partial [Mycena amicta]